jgi:hypothetical protein
MWQLVMLEVTTPQTYPDLCIIQMLWHILPVPKNLLLWQIQKPQPISEAKHKRISFLGKHLSHGNIIWHMENMPKDLHSA